MTSDCFCLLISLIRRKRLLSLLLRAARAARLFALLSNYRMFNWHLLRDVVTPGKCIKTLKRLNRVIFAELFFFFSCNGQRRVLEYVLRFVSEWKKRKNTGNSSAKVNWSEVELFHSFRSNSYFVSASKEHNGEQKTNFSCQELWRNFWRPTLNGQICKQVSSSYYQTQKLYIVWKGCLLMLPWAFWLFQNMPWEKFVPASETYRLRIPYSSQGSYKNMFLPKAL